MADPILTDVEKIPDFVPPGPIPENLGLGSCFAVLGRCDVVDDRLDFRIVEYAVLFPPFQISYCHRGGDFMTKNSVEIKHIGPGKRLVTHVGIENLFGNGLSHSHLPNLQNKDINLLTYARERIHFKSVFAGKQKRGDIDRPAPCPFCRLKELYKWTSTRLPWE